MKTVKKLLHPIILILAFALILSSCSKSADSLYGADGKADYSNGSMPENDMKEEHNSAADKGDAVIAEDRKIIKTVNQSLQTEDFEAALDNINSLISELGGYVVTSGMNGASYYNKDMLRSANLTVRIPADKLSSFVSGAESGAVVTSYRENAEDVSSAYIDVESKIAVYEAEETALLEMLEKSENVTTMLEIRTRLNEVQSTLASLKAQKNRFDTLVAYSTVYLNVNEVRQAVNRDPGFFEEIGANFSDSLYGIGRFFRNFAVWLIGDFLYIILWAAFISFVAFFLIKIRKTVKNRRNKNNSKDSDGDNN